MITGVCPKCNNKYLFGPVVKNEILGETMYDPVTCQKTWVLHYHRKLMCADCGYTIETCESKELNLHKLALLAEEENKEKTSKIEWFI